MNEYFPNKPPRRDLTPEEKIRIARTFCRRARLADGLCLLALLCVIAGIVTGWTVLEIAALLAVPPAVLLSAAAFTRCPCCGRMARQGERLGSFGWRAFECPVCGFMPEWGK